jgi:class 3 adenylate cyclase
VSLPAVAIAVLAATTRYPQVTSSETSNTVSGTLVAVVGAYVLEAARRRSFLANRRADLLLGNVLPAPIAERLKHGERRIAQQHDEATVLFADLVGFTELAAKMPAAKLVETLDEIFRGFDELARRHGLEKIKTRSATRTWRRPACRRRASITRARSRRWRWRCRRRSRRAPTASSSASGSTPGRWSPG